MAHGSNVWVCATKAVELAGRRKLVLVLLILQVVLHSVLLPRRSVENVRKATARSDAAASRRRANNLLLAFLRTLSGTDSKNVRNGSLFYFKKT